MCVLAVTGATKAASSLYDTMGMAAIGMITLIIVFVLFVGGALILVRAVGPIVKDLKTMTEANALLAERLSNAIESCGVTDDRERRSIATSPR